MTLMPEAGLTRWLVAVIGGALVVAGAGLGGRPLRRALFRWRTRREWRLLQRSYARDTRLQPLLTGINVLLRRVAQRREIQRPVAGLCGQAWLVLLDELGRTRRFSQGVGQILATGPYRREQDLAAAAPDVPALLALVEAWLREVL